MPGKLSFVLPVTLQERLRGHWKRAPNSSAATRTRLALASFVKYFEQADLLDFYLVCPAADLSALTELVASVTHDPRYRVVDELALCPDLRNAVNAELKPVGGWIAQQLIKLAISQQVGTSHYVTLDSDILCMKPFSHDSLVRDGRALTNVETPSDYDRIYKPQFRDHELTTKGSRFLAAAKILDYQRRDESSRRFYGETPVVLDTQSVRDLITLVGERLQQPWLPGLASRRGWTEYSLYFQFLEMTGRFDSICAPTDCNGVLDLERSVWHASVAYQQRRPYDVDHFKNNSQADSGYFVAIQSWLNPRDWLPPRHKTLEDFYAEVTSWLL